MRWTPGDEVLLRLAQTALLSVDQGAVVTLNGGKSWSSWYNQPTAQLYHVAADNAFPYRVCGGQQESGSACVQSRGDDGQITFREWRPVAVEEYGYAVPDPLDPFVEHADQASVRARERWELADPPQPQSDRNRRSNDIGYLKEAGDEEGISGAPRMIADEIIGRAQGK